MFAETSKHIHHLYTACQQNALTMEAVVTSETSVNLYQTTRRGAPENSNLFNVSCVCTCWDVFAVFL
jgi:hypothetical protein